MPSLSRPAFYRLSLDPAMIAGHGPGYVWARLHLELSRTRAGQDHP